MVLGLTVLALHSALKPRKSVPPKQKLATLNCSTITAKKVYQFKYILFFFTCIEHHFPEVNHIFFKCTLIFWTVHNLKKQVKTKKRSF